MNKHFRIRMRFAAVAVSVALAGSASHALANDDVVALKHALYGAGYAIGNVNGTMDEATRSALRSFQQDHDSLAVSGDADDATRRALGLIVAPTPQAKPVQQTASVEPEAVAQTAAAEDTSDGIEEDEDGGWSLF